MVAIVPVVVWLAPHLLQALQRDFYLTGRVPLWVSITRSVAEKPILGYGYSGYWFVSESWATHAARFAWLPGFAHNGYLDLLLDLGVVGLAVFLGSLAGLARRTCSLTSRGPAVSTSLAGFLFLFATVNLVESSIAVRNDFWWVIYVALVCQVSRESKGAMHRVDT